MLVLMMFAVTFAGCLQTARSLACNIRTKMGLSDPLLEVPSLCQATGAN